MLIPLSHAWTQLQKWLIIARCFSLPPLGVLIYHYERHDRGPGEEELVGLWQEYDPEQLPDGGSFYEFSADRTYEVFDYIGNTSKKLTLQKGIWYAGGDFIYFGRTFDYAAFGAVRFWRIEEFSRTSFAFAMMPAEASLRLGVSIQFHRTHLTRRCSRCLPACFFPL